MHWLFVAFVELKLMNSRTHWHTMALTQTIFEIRNSKEKTHLIYTKSAVYYYACGGQR